MDDSEKRGSTPSVLADLLWQIGVMKLVAILVVDNNTGLLILPLSIRLCLRPFSTMSNRGSVLLARLW